MAERFGFDYVSAISDPAREASDLGAAVEWFDDQPPAIIESRALLADKTQARRLCACPTRPRPAACATASRRCACWRNAPGGTRIVEGWVEGPCAMSADLRGLNTLMLDFFDDPPSWKRCSTSPCDGSGLRAGAGGGRRDLIGVGDAAASLVGPKLYASSCCPTSSG